MAVDGLDGEVVIGTGDVVDGEEKELLFGFLLNCSREVEGVVRRTVAFALGTLNHHLRGLFLEFGLEFRVAHFGRKVGAVLDHFNLFCGTGFISRFLKD